MYIYIICIYIYIKQYVYWCGPATRLWRSLVGLAVCRACMHVKSTISNDHTFDQNDLIYVCSSWSSRIGRNVIPEQQDRSKCCPGAAGQVEMSPWSSRTSRNVVQEHQDRSKCRPRATKQVEMSSQGNRTSRIGALEQQD